MNVTEAQTEQQSFLNTLETLLNEAIALVRHTWASPATRDEFHPLTMPDTEFNTWPLWPHNEIDLANEAHRDLLASDVFSSGLMRTSGNLTISGTTTAINTTATEEQNRQNWLNLTHLHVNGNLIMRRNIYMPRLAVINIVGGTAGTDFLIIRDASNIVGKYKQVGDEILVGTHFILGTPERNGNMLIEAVSNSTTTILSNNRFYVPGTILWSAANNSRLFGNSLYIAYGTNGNINLGGSGNGVAVGGPFPSRAGIVNTAPGAPQFYARRQIDMRFQGTVHYSGLFASFGAMNAGGNANNHTLTGFMLGRTATGRDLVGATTLHRLEGLNSVITDNMIDGSRVTGQMRADSFLRRNTLQSHGVGIREVFVVPGGSD
jgi:hypothetical protein